MTLGLGRIGFRAFLGSVLICCCFWIQGTSKFHDEGLKRLCFRLQNSPPCGCEPERASQPSTLVLSQYDPSTTGAQSLYQRHRRDPKGAREGTFPLACNIPGALHRGKNIASSPRWRRALGFICVRLYLYSCVCLCLCFCLCLHGCVASCGCPIR